MSEAAPTGDHVIHVPEPEGHKRSNLAFAGGNGLFVVDEDQDSLRARVVEFLRNPDASLFKVNDAVHGQPVYFTRTAIGECLLSIGISWVQNVAPKSDRVQIVRGPVPPLN